MELSEKIKKMIRDWEGCRLTAYRCPAGVLTIGYGHTGSDVKEGMKITMAKAIELFNADIAKFSKTVENTFKGTKLNNNQFDALVSFSYNVGSFSAKAPTLMRMVKANPDDILIRDEMMKHVYAKSGGVNARLPGLVKRRTAEANHYFSKI
jgi:lysozyme